MKPNPADPTLVPFLGAFSSGKSSLINALMGTKLLSTHINPETALPIELRYGKKAAFSAHTPGGTPSPLSQQAFTQADFGAVASQRGWVQAQVPELKPWPDLLLVDLPGWASGQTQDENLLDAYLHSLLRTHLEHQILYVLVVAADEGTLRSAMLQQLRSLDLDHSPYLLLLSKCDLRPASDIASIAAHLHESVSSALGKAPQALLQCSARKNQIDGLRSALDQAQRASGPKAPAVDKAQLRAQIERYLEHISEVQRDVRDLRVYIFDDVWDELSDNLLEYWFEDIPYARAKSAAEMLRSNLERNYEQTLAKHIQRSLSPPPQELLATLKQLGLSPPQPNTSSTGIQKLARDFKSLINTAVEKSEPGWLSSSDPEDVGKRLMRNVRSQRDKFRACICSYAGSDLHECFEQHSQAWQRLQVLVGG